MTQRAVLALVAAVVVAGCQQSDDDLEAPVSIQLSSDAFADGAAIPLRHTCDGEDVPPPMAWSGVPEGTEELALVVEDPDAPGGVFVHWVVAGLPLDTEGVDGELPAEAVEGRNGFGTEGYRGPCPPEGDEPHRYTFTLFASDRRLGLDARVTADDLRRALEGSVLAQGRLTGTYGR